jgi:hypothetical protein
VSANTRSPDYDRLRITVDAATGVPVHVVGTLRGRFRFELRVEHLVVDARLPAGVFALRFSPGKEVLHQDDGFRRVDLADAGARLGYAPLVPHTKPSGYAFDVAAVAGQSPAAATAVPNPPSRRVFSLSYRRGFDQFVVTTRVRGSGRWRDPFRVVGVPVHHERIRLRAGALAGVSADVVIDARTVPHLWAQTRTIVVTVSGDLSRDQLLAVAQSLRPVGAATATTCRASSLRLDVALQGATGSLAGVARLVNAGDRVCTLEGRPRVALERSDGTRLPVRVLASRPAYPPVELRPGDAADVDLFWSNWCGGTSRRLRLRLVVPHGRGTVTAVLPPGAPRCDEPRERSTLRVGWFRPPA